jgi:hypothetical protein
MINPQHPPTGPRRRPPGSKHSELPGEPQVDEAWLLLQHPVGAAFLLRAAKAGRKHWCGLTVATQDTADVLASDLGRAVITNSATQILLRQAPQAIDEVARVFGLSAGERALLLTAERGEGLLTGGELRAGFTALASAEEDRLITTDPAQVEASTDDGWIDLDPPHAGPSDGTPPSGTGPHPLSRERLADGVSQSVEVPW